MHEIKPQNVVMCSVQYILLENLAEIVRDIHTHTHFNTAAYTSQVPQN